MNINGFLMRGRSSLALFVLIFALSGLSGLIYESIWSHYLKLFLGHAAYAQTLVLTIFMGGMALGSWVCSQFSSNWKNLLLVYAIVEAIIGIAALLFHNVFDAAIQVAYDIVIPNLGSPFLAHSFKWVLAAILILPQSILLGMTFPLMSAGIIRRFPKHPGHTISILYFANSIGAAIGVLTSGFLLISLVGLPGTIIIAGLINIALAITVWSWVKDDQEYEYAPEFDAPPVRPSIQSQPQWFQLMLVVALLTGAASFIYEIAWIRMLSLVLGSSTHAFELMLSAFILGLALGGLWIKSRIDKITNVVFFLAMVQLLMAVLALSTLPLYNYTFNVMQWLFNNLDKTDTGYQLFNLSSHAIAIAIMLPTTFCAGMTLPLITFSLLKFKHGEKSIGAVYAANTLGAIIGIFVAVHIGLPYIGLKGVLSLGAAIDIAIALSLLYFIRSKALKTFKVATGVSIASLLIAIFIIDLDLYKMSSAVYRRGTLIDPNTTEILYHKDGKTSTVDLQRTQGHLLIRTNGKVDANINMVNDGTFTLDEPTMILSAILPLALNPQAQNAAVIGIGSGLTTHNLLAMPTLASVDTIEIEAAMAEAAQGFRPRVERTFSDPRSHIYIEDAKTYFSITNKRYDIIVSEPSNPWVSGIASLFSQEFYQSLPKHLNEGGIFVQWVQLYELNVELVASIIKALSGEFDDYAIYLTSNIDMLIVAKNGGALDLPNDYIFNYPAIRDELKNIKIHTIDDLNLRRIGTKYSLDTLFNSYKIRANSDYYPVLDIGAAKARYFNQDARALVAMSYANLPIPILMDNDKRNITITTATSTKNPIRAMLANIATSIRDNYYNGLDSGDSANGTTLPPKYRQVIAQIERTFKNCEPTEMSTWIQSLLDFSGGILPFLSISELDNLWQDLISNTCYPQLSPKQKDWISLMHAVSLRQGKTMAGLSKWLLDYSVAVTKPQYEFLLSTAMLGETLLGRTNNARDIWNTHKNNIDVDNFKNLQLRLLVAQFGGVRNTD